MSKIPPLSLCMIVKNEENFLEKCLLSVKDLVDEIIIVDTGSSDSTKEIAKKFTDKIYNFEWCDDFSAARNESLKHATKEWILVLDADEVISQEDFDRIKLLITDSSAVEGFFLEQRNYIKTLNDLNGIKVQGMDIIASSQNEMGFINSQNDSYKESLGVQGWFLTPIVRLFKNLKSVSFSGVVHESVTPSLSKIEKSSIPIHHFGKMDKQTWQKKWVLYEKLAEKKVLENKDYYSYFELGRQYLASRKLDQAKQMFLKSNELNDKYWVNWLNLGGIYLIEDNIESARDCLEKAKLLNPNSVDVYKNLGVVYAKKKNFVKAIDMFVLGLNLNANQPGIFKNMGLCYQEMGDSQRAKLAFGKAEELLLK
jgi:O-antigen biosynthesis protein